MKKIFYIIICFTFAAALYSCDEYDFKQEQYRNDISLLSNSRNIYDTQIADLSKDENTIYLVATVSGSQPTERPYLVSLVSSDSLFNAYNKSNFDIDKDKFAKLLPEECYDFPELEMNIKTGDSKVEFPIHLKNLDKISPDSTYFLNYKIDRDKVKNYNKEKQDVLIRIYKENFYASTKKATYYNYTNSTIATPDNNGNVTIRRPTSTNRVFPISKDKVRMLAGDEDMGDYKTAKDRIIQKSIIIEMGEQTMQEPLAKHIKISPMPIEEGNDDIKPVDIVQLNPYKDYDNTFLINVIRTPDGRATYYKEFRMHYKYRLDNTKPYRIVKAILRYEYNPTENNL